MEKQCPIKHLKIEKYEKQIKQCYRAKGVIRSCNWKDR